MVSCRPVEISADDIRIKHGTTADGLFYIFVFEGPRTEFRCQHVQVWLGTEVATTLSTTVDNMTVWEIDLFVKRNRPR